MVKSPITFCVRVFTALELFPFHHYVQPAPIESQPVAVEAVAAVAAQRTMSSMHHRGIFPSCSEFLVLSGKRFMSIQTAGAGTWFFLNHHSERGAGQHSAPPRLCLSQLLGRSTFPTISLRGKTEARKTRLFFFFFFLTPPQEMFQLARKATDTIVLRRSQWIWETRMRDYLMQLPFKRPIQSNQSILINGEMTGDEIPPAAAKLMCQH